MRSYAVSLCLCLFSIGNIHAFTTPRTSIGGTAHTAGSIGSRNLNLELSMAPKDPSRSGTKRGRMDKLAEMEELGSANSDNSVFIQAAGAFVGLIVIAIAAAASSGLLTQY
mmetsp:Transcript_20141/g.41752  ORF Transcript_20141/g.41752 Transcript_20141/m.41752 type:complete len:111 (-) Transcript_20141:2050-2382(-)